MGILKNRSILKLATIFMLVAMMAGAFAGHSKAAVAARAGACDPTKEIQGDTTSGGGTTNNCDMTVTPNVVVQGITFNSTANVTLSATPASGDNFFTFTTIVTDTRAITGIGWHLDAKSAGLTLAGHPSIDLTILSVANGTTITCTGGSGTCGTTSDTADATLNTSAGVTPIVTNSHDGTTNTGVVTIVGKGKYTISGSTFPGAYSGTITLSLLPTP